MGPVAPTDWPEWTDGAAYAWLREAEPAALAWEWLRRDERFCSAALEALSRDFSRTARDSPSHWGLHAFEDPRQPFPVARPVWTRERHPWVLQAIARAARGDEDSIDFRKFSLFAKTADAGASAHLLLSDGLRTIRIDVEGWLPDQPLMLAYCLSGLRDLWRPLLVLKRLRSLAMSGRFAPSLHRAAQRTGRHIRLLRAFDALRAGAVHADLAQVLLTTDFARTRWRVHSPSLRSRAQRLAREANRMAGGAFWQLLR